MPEVNVCGTGGWTGPLPGDPDNSISLSATSTFGGISVRWTYPTVNSHAVAHTLLYRGTTSNFAASIERGVVAGNTFFDSVGASVLYYYWIRVVSVHGTVGDLVGPASATSRKLSTDVVELLSGQISAGALATSLRNDIDKITLNYAELTDEINARISSNASLSAALATVQSGVIDAATVIQSEITTRTNGQNALASQINTIGALNASNIAAITTEQTARVTADSALASSITTVLTQTNNNTAAIITEQTARTDADSALATNITSVQAATNTAAAAIVTEQTARANADSALATNIASVLAATNAAAAAVVTETNARTTADSALASSITTAQSTLNGSISSVQVTLQTNINTVSSVADGAKNKADALGALYTVQVSSDGLVGGFGIYNNGATIEAGFEVDTFWIGRTASDKVLPFIVSGGVVYINKARIKDADIDTLKIAGNAVTIPIGTTNASTIYFVGAETDIISVSLDAGGAPIFSTATLRCSIGFSGGVNLRMYVGGTLSSIATVMFGVDQTVTLTGHIASSSGATTCRITAECFGGASLTINPNAATLFAIGTKR